MKFQIPNHLRVFGIWDFVFCVENQRIFCHFDGGEITLEMTFAMSLHSLLSGCDFSSIEMTRLRKLEFEFFKLITLKNVLYIQRFVFPSS
jgi:hypothetical protein